MRIAITGSSGLLGTAVSDRLRGDGHSVTRVVRSRDAAEAEDAIYWRPSRGEIDADGLAGHDAVINLAGENIAGLWTPAKKRRIRDSRVLGTLVIAETIAGLDVTDRPRVLVNASARGYYGDRPGDVRLTEDAGPGATFMAELVRDWEAATDRATEAGVRVLLPRFGLVLDPDGLLLRAMTRAASFGLGATLGDGGQDFAWVTRDEIVNVIPFLLGRDDIRGPVNVVAPHRITNAELTDTLAAVLGRPRFLRVPEFALRMLGDLGEELLSGAWVVPEKLNRAGYAWVDPDLEPALRRLLDR